MVAVVCADGAKMYSVPTTFVHDDMFRCRRSAAPVPTTPALKQHGTRFVSLPADGPAWDAIVKAMYGAGYADITRTRNHWAPANTGTAVTRQGDKKHIAVFGVMSPCAKESTAQHAGARLAETCGSIFRSSSGAASVSAFLIFAEGPRFRAQRTGLVLQQ